MAPFHSDGEEEGGAAYIGLTQEIDSAVERVMSSMMSSPGREGGRGTGGLGEEFAPESLRGWERNTTPGEYSTTYSALPPTWTHESGTRPLLVLHGHSFPCMSKGEG